MAKRKAAIGLIEKMLVSVQINQEQMKENKIGMLKKGISLKDVSVSIGNKNVLHHLNFEFEIGKKYAVVGSSGAGKSTLINTIMDGFSPVQGEVLFDGIDSRAPVGLREARLHATIYRKDHIFCSHSISTVEFYVIP